MPAVIVAVFGLPRRETADFTVRIAPAAIRPSGYNARGSDGSRERRRKYLWPALMSSSKTIFQPTRPICEFAGIVS